MQPFVPRCAEEPKHVTFKVVAPTRPPLRFLSGEADRPTEGGLVGMNMNAFHSVAEAEEKRNAKFNKAKATGVAALVPVSAEDEFEADYAVKLQLQLWQGSLQEELRFYRSVVVATELLLQRVDAACHGQRQPNILSTATALTIFSYFIPLFGGYSELARGIMEELSHVIFVSPAKSTSIETSATAYARKTFFESFFSVCDSYYFHNERSEKFALMMAREQRVLERAVHTWQCCYAQKLLQKWHSFTRNQIKLRLKYKRTFRHATSSQAAAHAITHWRRYAHHMQLHKLANMNTETKGQLQAAHRIKRLTEQRLKDIEEERTSKDNRFQEINQSCAKVQRQMDDEKRRMDVLLDRYCRIRQQWIDSLLELFDDCHQVPPGGNYIAWVSQVLGAQEQDTESNLGDTVVNAEKQVKEQLARLNLGEAVGSEGFIFQAIASRRKGASRTKINAATLIKLLCLLSPAGSLCMQKQAGDTIVDQAESVVALFQQVTNGCIAPIHSEDIVRGDQLKIRSFLLLLMELWAGGYCSAFFPNHCAADEGTENKTVMKPSSVPFKSSFQSQTATDRENLYEQLRNQVVGHSLGLRRTVGELPDSEIATMTKDWEEGKASVMVTKTLKQRSTAVWGEVVQFGESIQLQREAQKFFDFLVASGGSASMKHLIGAALEKWVKEEDLDVVKLVYPPEGITTITDMVQYISDIAEITGIAPLQALQLLEQHVELSDTMSFILSVREKDVQMVVKSFEVEIERTFESHLESSNAPVLEEKDSPRKRGESLMGSPKKVKQKGKEGSGDANLKHFTKASFRNFLLFTRSNVYCCMTDEEADQIYDHVHSICKKMDYNAFVVLLNVVATYCDPSPYTSIPHKLKVFLATLFRA